MNELFLKVKFNAIYMSISRAGVNCSSVRERSRWTSLLIHARLSFVRVEAGTKFDAEKLQGQKHRFSENVYGKKFCQCYELP